ncbi:hypothetical protein LR48_Vigan11g006900 [Vigna angularis]|uniref:Uncharacterized protein n=1 Tax=Phaseolus angularis TaxID=3914 RepID=A0A0L9VQ78_PHAAN|nr:hypothetical protein LR48_Vigan11g006900 [Vigna angularis]
MRTLHWAFWVRLVVMQGTVASAFFVIVGASVSSMRVSRGRRDVSRCEDLVFQHLPGCKGLDRISYSNQD